MYVLIILIFERLKLKVDTFIRIWAYVIFVYKDFIFDVLIQRFMSVCWPVFIKCIWKIKKYYVALISQQLYFKQ